MAELVDNDVTIPKKLHIKVEVRQLLPVDQDLRHFMWNGVWKATGQQSCVFNLFTVERSHTHPFKVGWRYSIN